MNNLFKHGRWVIGLALAAVAATTNSLAFDTARTDNLTLTMAVGAATGSPDASNKLDVTIRYSDTLAAADFVALPDDYYLTRTDGTLAKFTNLDAAGAFGKTYIAAIRKPDKRYVIVTWTKTGTISAPISLLGAFALLGDMPVPPVAQGVIDTGLSLT